MNSTHRPTDPIPEHLTPYIATQDMGKYTPIDHATWRFILRISKEYFKKHAHRKYLEGLEKTGISQEEIPNIDHMDACLRKLGWRAVPVSGFIPPSVFMEFQSLGVLPIACDMRNLSHLAYTPAPDIVHEAAGHAPFIIDSEYGEYLRNYGEVSRKAIFSDKDMAVYEAIRALSDIKEDPRSTEETIDAAQRKLDQAIALNTYVSEASYLSRMNWWTVEYGLVGPIESPHIYGAGLLSSVGESQECLSESVRKIPFSLDCINMSYDITKQQPQLFVTPHFQELNSVLEEFSKTMAFRKGGVIGLTKAKTANALTTTVLDSGIQISGVLKNFIQNSENEPIYLQFLGPVQLAENDCEIEGHSASYHKDGFGTPTGPVAELNKSPADLTEEDFQRLGFSDKKASSMKFSSGITLYGILESTIKRNGKNLILTFSSCTVNHGDKILFDPSWGPYDMACGKSVVSVFGNAADRPQYLKAVGLPQKPKNTQNSNLTEENAPLNALYGEVRKMRTTGAASEEKLKEILENLDRKFPDDWLLRLEIYELSKKNGFDSSVGQKCHGALTAIAKDAPQIRQLIQQGLDLS